MTVCRKLRWKGYYGVQFFDEDERWESLLRSNVPFTCNRTCQHVGPDDQLVHPEGCGPDRDCFEGPKTS